MQVLFRSIVRCARGLVVLLLSTVPLYTSAADTLTIGSSNNFPPVNMLDEQGCQGPRLFSTPVVMLIFHLLRFWCRKSGVIFPSWTLFLSERFSFHGDMMCPVGQSIHQ